MGKILVSMQSIQGYSLTRSRLKIVERSTALVALIVLNFSTADSLPCTSVSEVNDTEGGW